MSEHTPTTETIRAGYAEVHYFNYEGKRYREEYEAEFDRWLARERAEARREAIVEFAKQHGIGDATSRPLYDAQQQLADAKAEIERLRAVEREIDGQRLELAAAWEMTCEAVDVDTDSTLGEWQTAFDECVAHYHASGYKAGKRDALEEAAGVLDVPGAVNFGDGGVFVRVDFCDPNRDVPLVQWLRELADELEGK